MQNPDLAIYYLKYGQFEQVKPRPYQIEIDNMRCIANNIRNERYEPTPGKHCSDCAFNNICEYSKNRN